MLGQSFGGFTSLTYLSIAPEGLEAALITGGLAPVTNRPVDDVYGATWERLREANRRYFERYPDDRARVREAHRRIEDEDVRLPSGDRLSVRRFRQLGMWLGDCAGFEHLHHVLELPFGSPAFLHDVENAVRWTRNPLYATLHESSYADGGPTRWSSHRLTPDWFEGSEAFTAEHVFPWMWEEYGGLRAHRDAAELLAEHPWPRLYDEAQLARNEVPVAATIYVDDLYVERAFAEETAALVRGPAAVDHQRVRPQRAARGRRARRRPADRHGQGSGLSPATPDGDQTAGSRVRAPRGRACPRGTAHLHAARGTAADAAGSPPVLTLPIRERLGRRRAT